MSRYFLADPVATEQFAKVLWPVLPYPAIVYLQGDLGAGKTSLVRACLRAAGFEGTVKSPTYTLVETYQIGDREICHFDFYRISEPSELADLGIRDYFSRPCLCFIEWPEHAHGELPQADLTIRLTVEGEGRLLILIVS